MTVVAVLMPTALAPTARADGPDVLATVTEAPAVRWLAPATTRIAVENAGDAVASGPIEVVVNAGAGRSATASGDGWECGPFPSDGHLVATCVRSAPLAAGDRAPDIRVVSPADATNSAASIGGTFSVRADVRAPTATSRNTSSAMRSVVRDTQADVAVSVNGQGPVRLSDPRRYAVHVRNAGLAASGPGVRIAFESPAGAPTVTGAGWICDRDARTCTHPDALAPGAQAAELDVVAPPGDGSFERLLARVADPGRTSGAVDRNDADEAYPVLAPDGDVDLATAIAPTGRPVVDRESRFAIRVRNAGDGPSTGRVSVDLRGADNQLDGVRTSGDGWDCTAFTTQCTTDAVVAPGEELPPITARISSSGSGSITTPPVVATVSTAGDTRADNDRATGRQSSPDRPDAIDLAVELPAAPAPGAASVATIRPRTPAGISRPGPLDLELDAPRGSTASGDGWLCTRTLRCRLAGDLADGASAPPLTVRTPETGPATPIGALRFGATELGPAGGQGVMSGGEVATGARAGDVTVAFRRLEPLSASETGTVPVVVRNSGSLPVHGTTVVRLTTEMPGRATGDGWACGPVRDDIRRCAHDGPIPAAGALPDLDWRLVGAASDEDGGVIRAAVDPPEGADVAPLNNHATGSLLPQPERPTGLTGSWAELSPATATHEGEVAFVVRNHTPVAVDGRVEVQSVGSWRPDPADGWRCDASCVHDGPVPADAALPPLRGTITPDRRSDASDFLLANLVTGEGAEWRQYQAVVPAARGPRPELSVGFLGAGQGVPGTTIQLSASLTADRLVAGPAELRLRPTPGLVVERVEAADTTCTTALRCTVRGGIGPDRDRSAAVTVRIAPDVVAPLGLTATLSSAGARPSTRRMSVVPIAAGGDLTTTLEAPSVLDGSGAGTVVQRVRNDGSEPIAGPIVASVRLYDSLDRTRGRSGDGWRCAANSGSCRYEGELAPGAALPPLTFAVSGVTAAPATLEASVGSRASDDTVGTNSTATATMARGAIPAPTLAASVAATDQPTHRGDATFSTVVRNVGALPTAEPVEVSYGESQPVRSAPVDGEAAWSCRSGSGRCVLDRPLAAGEAAPPLISTRPASDDPWAPVRRQTELTASADPSGRHGVAALASVDAVSTSAADVAVAVSAGRPAQERGEVRQTVRVTNLGTARTPEPVEVAVTARDGAELTVAGDGWTCPGRGAVCRLDGDVLDAGESAPPLVVDAGPLGFAVDDAGVVASATGDGDGDGERGNDVGSSRLSSASSPGPAEIGAAFDDVRPTPAGATATGLLRLRHLGTGAPSGPVVVDVAGIGEAHGDGWSCGSAGTEDFPAVRCERPEPPTAGGALPSLALRDAPTRRYDSWDAYVVEPEPADRSEPAASVTPAIGRPGVELAVALTGGRPVAADEETTLVARVQNAGPRPGDGRTVLELDAPQSVVLTPRGEGWTCESRRCTTEERLGARSALPPVEVAVRGRRRDGGGTAQVVATARPEAAGGAPPPEAVATATVGVGAAPVDLVPRVVPVGGIRAGSPSTTRLRVANVGSQRTRSATTVEVGAPFGGTLTGPGWTCDGLRCTHPGPLAAGDDLPALELVADVPRDAALAPATTTVRASNADDGRSDNDLAAADRGVAAAGRTGPKASMAVSAGFPAPSGAPGDRVPVQVVIRDPDDGAGGPASTVVELPEGLAFDAVPAGDPEPLVAGRRLTWDEPLPAAGTSAAWTFWARVGAGAAPGPRVLRSSLSSGPITAESTATFTVTDPPPPDPDPGTTPDPQPAPDPDPVPGPGGGTSTTPGDSVPKPPGDDAAGLAALLAALGGRAPGSGPAPPPSPSPRPELTVRFLGAPRPPRAATLAHSGWLLGLRTTGEAATVRAELVADASTARRLRVRTGTVLARAAVGDRTAGTVRVRLRVSSVLRAKVRRATRVSGVLRVRTTTKDGSATVSRRVVVRR